jgi:hypothetical protein
MVRAWGAPNVIDLAEERARRRRHAGASIIPIFGLSLRGILLWAAYWRWALSGFQREN